MEHEDDEDDAPLSRTAIRNARRAAIDATRGVVEAVADLPAERYAAIEMDAGLRREIDIARDLKASGARNRQIAFVAKRISDVDVEALQAHLAGFEAQDEAEKAVDAALEEWRARIVAEGDEAIEALLAIKPQADRQRLRQLARRAQDASGGAKARRAIFKALRALWDDDGPG